MVCFHNVYGDVALVRSGPMDSSFSVNIDKEELKQTIEFYKTNDSSHIFALREESRALRKMGMPQSMMKKLGGKFVTVHDA